MFRWNFVLFSLCPLLLVLSHSLTEKSLVSSCSFFPVRYLHVLTSSPLSLFFSRVNSPLSLILSCDERYSISYIIFVHAGWTVSSMSMSLYWGPQNCTQHSRSGLTSAEQRGRVTSISLGKLATLFHIQPYNPRYCWLVKS